MNNQSSPQIVSLLSEKVKRAPRWISFLMLFLVVVVTPVTILLLDHFITPAQSWYNSSWEYRKPITVANPGTSKSNYDVLVSIDTSSLVAAGKIQNDCDDIRFVDSDDSTTLSYWVEGGCNTVTTQVWVRVPSLPSGGKQIYIYYGNASATNAQQAWAGQFIVMSGTSCPVGWTRVSALDNRFIRGAVSYGATGGVDTHNHGSVTGTSGGPTATSTTNTAACNSVLSSVEGHSGVRVDTNNTSIVPPYVGTVFCQASNLNLSSGAIGIFNTSVPVGWTRVTALDGRFPRGAATYGTTGGSDTHTHPYAGGYSTAGSSGACSAGADGGGDGAWEGHSHTSLSGTTAAATNTPPYLNIIYGSINSNGVAPGSMITPVTVLPPLGWTRFTSLDSRFPRGASTYGATGGAGTHTHSLTVILSTYVGGRHPRNSLNEGTLSSSYHAHTMVANTVAGSNIPTYTDVIFGQKKNNATDSITASIGYEESNAPAAPTAVPAQALSTSSIRWNFVDNANNEVGFKVLDGLGEVKATCVGENLTYCDETGLQANTQYTRYIVAYNNNGDSLQSSAVSRYTETSVPAVSITSVNGNSMALSVTGTTNLGAGSSAVFIDCTVVGCETGVETWTTNTTANVTSLTQNTQYTFQVKARNGDGAETAYSLTVSNYTYADVPEINVASANSSSVTVEVNNIPNLSSGQSGIFYYCTGCVAPAGWVSGSQNTFSGLTPNTQVSITAKARNGDGVETAISSALVTNSYAAVPLAPAITDIGTNTLRVSLNENTNGNPTSVLYAVKYNGSNYINPTNGTLSVTPVWADFDTWNTGGGVLVSGLEEGIQHTLLAVAKNSNDVVTADGASTSVYTLLKTPTISAPQVLSNQSIRWNFTDTGNNEEGFKVYNGNGDLVATCVGVNLSYCDETSLNANTSYTRYVKAYNANTESAASSTQSAVTHASVPSVVGIAGTQGRVSFNLSMNGNPGGTEVLIQDETTGYYYNSQTGELVASPYWFEYVSTGTDFLVNNLQANTQYSLKVKARNSENVETSFSPVSSVYTHAVVPSIESVDGLTPTSLKVVLATEGNPSTTEYVLRDVNANKYVDDSTGTLVDNPVWATYADFGGAEGIDITSLSSNTEYVYEVKARNSDGVETAYSAQTSGFTLASTPTIEDVQNSSATVLIVTIGNGGNPSNTEFAIRENGSGQYVNSTSGVLQASPSWATYAQWGGVTGFGVTALSPNSSYSFSSVARNLENINSSFSGSQSLYTLANIPGSVTTDSVGVTSLNVVLDPNGNPAATEFALYNSTRSKYIDFNTGNESDTAVWGTYAQWGSGSGYLISGLDSGTTYEFVSKARNANQVETSFGVGSNISTSLAAPTIGTATRLSETSIRWNFTDNENNELGYRVYDADGVQVAECVGTNLTSCIEYGMTPNTQYTRKIAAYNNTGRGDYSDTLTRYTAASVPQFTSVEAPSSTTVKIVLNSNGNPTNTLFQIREVVSGLRVGNLNNANGTLVNSDVWYTYNDLGGSNGVFVNELFANAEYIFEVVAKDGEDTITSASSQSTIYTLAVTTAAPTLTALSDSRLKVVVDNGGNPAITTFSLRDVKSSKYFNYSNGLWQDSPVWGTYAQWGSTEGVSVNGLALNNEYEYQVVSRNNQGIETAASTSSKLFTLANVPGRVYVSTNASNNLVVRLSSNSNPASTQYSVFDLVTNRYLDPRTGSFTTSVVWGTLADFGGANGIVLSGLTAGARVELIAKARNGNQIETSTSSSFVAHAVAGIPGIGDITPITLRSARIRINRVQNDPSVVYSIYEESQQRYVDFRTGLLVAQQVWGTYTEFGGDNGVLVLGLTPVTDYSFRVNARNGAGVITGLGARRTYGTNAIIENVPAGLAIALRSNNAVDPSKDLGGQRGLQDVRVMKDGKILADIPVEFSQNRDWNGVVIESQSGRVVVKMSENSGYKGTYSMYVEKGDTNRFKLCTKAEEIDQVNSDCAGSVVFAGPFPQTIDVEGKPITVSIAVIDSVSYWVVSGLTGTGGLGEKIDTDGEVIKEPTDNVPDEDGEGEENPDNPTPEPVVVINTPNQTVNAVVNGAANLVVAVPQQATAAIDGVKIALDNSVVGELEEPQLTAVATTATAATVTVGLAAVGGGFSTVPYMITQFFLGVLSFLGFRKKGKPYGYVYNSVSKEPVSRAIVRIYDTNDRLVWTDVTDVYGSFNAELPKGQYKILVKKAGFTYPTEIIKGLVDYPLEPIYKGDLFKMSQKTDIKVLIPIDPTDVNKFSALAVSTRTTINTLFKVLHALIFVGGIILAVYTILKFPTLLNWVVLAFYVPAFMMLFKSIFGQQSKYGYVRDVKGKPVANVEVALKELKFDRFVAKRVTDASGRYRFVMYPGAYELVVTSSDYKAMKFDGGSSVINIGDKSDKVVAKDITVRKK